jgi:hypothetical protein
VKFCYFCPLKWAYNEFLGGKKDFSKGGGKSKAILHSWYTSGISKFKTIWELRNVYHQQKINRAGLNCTGAGKGKRYPHRKRKLYI